MKIFMVFVLITSATLHASVCNLKLKVVDKTGDKETSSAVRVAAENALESKGYMITDKADEYVKLTIRRATPYDKSLKNRFIHKFLDGHGGITMESSSSSQISNHSDVEMSKEKYVTQAVSLLRSVKACDY